jgi:hypothetical protein
VLRINALRASITTTVSSKTADATFCVLTSSIVNGSKDFDEFLDMLGEKVQLKGWTKYNGGLDVECKIKLIALI